MGLAWKGMVHVLMWLGDVKQLETGSKESGNTEAVRARTVRSVAGLCCCPHSPTSAVLKSSSRSGSTAVTCSRSPQYYSG